MRLPRSFTRCLAVTLSVIFFTALAQAQQPNRQKPAPEFTLTLLQLNDVYQISPVDRGKNAGLARVATLRKQILAESPNTLFVLAGDTISPSVASSVFKGSQIIAVWNAIGLDYAALGNHEFDFGNEVLLDRMKESKFVWLGSNVIDRETNKPFNGMPPYLIREFNGVKIGFFGLLTVDTQTTSKPGDNLRFVDPILTTKDLVKKMRREGAKVIVAITHLDMSVDQKLAATGLVDLILGGHEHELLQSLAGRAPIFKWGSDARTLGRIDLHIRAADGKLMSMDWEGIPVNDTVQEDSVAATVVREYESKLSVELDKPVGRTEVALDALQPSNRSRETNLGNLVADAYRQSTNADAAIVNGGSIRSNSTYPAGTLSKRDVISILPFENPLVKIEVSGALLRAALENGVSQIVEEKESGRFPQVSGLEFEYDGRRPPGSRVVKVVVNGQPLDEAKSYSIAMSSYTATGGDGYTMFKNAKYLINAESAEIDSTVMIKAIAAAGAVSPKVEGRIKRLDNASGQ